MSNYGFRILNVFTFGDDPFSGNPLCVFENAEALSDTQMLALARQFNLSETTFILPPSSRAATARVRIFTPCFEMPFAGHPTLGTAQVVRALAGSGDRVVLEMKAGLIEVTAKENSWSLRAATAPTTRMPNASMDNLAAALGLGREVLAQAPLWVDTGVEQLVIPLVSPEAVKNAKPNTELLTRHGWSDKRGVSMAYVWAREGDGGNVVARFFEVENGSVKEDAATGSACANLGGWMLATGESLPVSLDVRQGDAVRRPSLLRLRVEKDGRIFVTGSVLEVARGTIVVV